MKHQTSSLQLCSQPTVLTLTQSTTRFRGSCRIVCTTARFVTSTSWSRAWSKSGNISTRWSSIKRSGSGVHVLELAFDIVHTVDILNTDFRCAEVLPFARTHTWQSITRGESHITRWKQTYASVCQDTFRESHFRWHCNDNCPTVRRGNLYDTRKTLWMQQ